MSKKRLTIGFVKDEFEKIGWVCTSNEYINNNNLLNYICQNGHCGVIRWADWKQGHRCPICTGVKKHTIEYIKKEFEKKGWICLSDKYVNAHSKLEYICPNGHHGFITWNSWQQGSGCSICSDIKKRHPIGFIKSEFEKEGWECLSTEYVNAHQKLDYICSKGHIGAIAWHHWQKGRRCQSCMKEKLSLRYSGSGNPSWKGGISCEPYCQDWTKEYKDYIKERDNYKCLNPHCNSKSPDKLAVHHINYNKKSCGPDNLITICRSCNATANKDREWHESWYKAIMYRRYGYQYKS